MGNTWRPYVVFLDVDFFATPSSFGYTQSSGSECDGIVGGRLVPDTSLFSDVLSLYKKKTAVTKRPKGVSRNKQRKVAYCLA